MNGLQEVSARMLKRLVRIAHNAQRGATMPELLVATLALSLVAAGALAGYRSLSRVASASASAAEGSEALVALQRVIEELGNAVQVTEAYPRALTVVASTSSSAADSQYTDPATGLQGTLRRYTVRYYFQGGTLYRTADSGPAKPVARYETLQFLYYDANGNPTSAPSQVRQIVVTARASARNASGKVILGGRGATGTASRGTSSQPTPPRGGGSDPPPGAQPCPPGYYRPYVPGIGYLPWCLPRSSPGTGSPTPTPTPTPNPTPTPGPIAAPTPPPGSGTQPEPGEGIQPPDPGGSNPGNPGGPGSGPGNPDGPPTGGGSNPGSDVDSPSSGGDPDGWAAPSPDNDFDVPGIPDPNNM